MSILIQTAGVQTVAAPQWTTVESRKRGHALAIHPDTMAVHPDEGGFLLGYVSSFRHHFAKNPSKKQNAKVQFIRIISGIPAYS
jgi:hypothetical protein